MARAWLGRGWSGAGLGCLELPWPGTCRGGQPLTLAAQQSARALSLTAVVRTRWPATPLCPYSGDQVQAGKPAPDIFLTAARTWPEERRPQPDECLVFEDAPSGVAAGVAAGMHVVMVPDPNLDRALCAGAHEVREG